MGKKKNKTNNTKNIILIVGVLVFCLVIGFTVGKYLFELTHPEIDLLTKITF